MKLRPVHPHAALVLEDANANRYIAVSDLHIGLESELDEKGISLGANFVEEMAAELSGLVKKESADGLILLGDIKHKVGTISRQEWNQIPQFLKKLSNLTQVHLVPGNHDGNIGHLVPPEINVTSNRGMVIEDTLFLHGHSMPSELRGHVKRIVMGHVHPVFLKTGSVVSGDRVWVHIRARKQAIFHSGGPVDLVVVPSFNKYLYATGPKSYRKSLSPILTRIMAHPDGIEHCIVARLDGSIVGDAALLQSIL